MSVTAATRTDPVPVPVDPAARAEELLAQLEGLNVTARDLPAAEEALREAKAAEKSVLIGRALLVNSSVQRNIGQTDRSRAYASEAAHLFHTIGDRTREVAAHYAHGTALWHERRWSEALVSLERAYAMAVEVGDAIRQIRAQNMIAVILGHLGNYSRSLAAFDTALLLTGEEGLETERLLLLNNKAQTLLHRARTATDPAETVRYGAAAYDVLMPEGMKLAEVWAPTYLRAIRDTTAQCLLLRRQAPEALALFRENLDYALNTGNDLGVANARIGLSEALLDLGNAQEAADGCAEVLREFASRLGPEDVARSHLTLSRALSALGRHDEALQRFMSYHELVRHASEDITDDYARHMEVILELEKSKGEALAFRRMADDLRTAQAAVEAASHARSEFFSNMSHELRTPLNAIIGFADIMRSEVFGALPSRYRSYVEDIHRSGHHLLELIGQLLDLAKAEAGKMELFEEKVSLDVVITDSLTLVREAASAGNIRLGDFTPTGLMLQADALRLRQCMINVLANAVKFTLPNGRVSVRVYIQGEHLCIEIVDTGVGLNPEDLPKVFDRFGQGGNARAVAGTGLGLPLTKQLIELHGGSVALSSMKDVGTTVVLQLPASRILPQ